MKSQLPGQQSKLLPSRQMSARNHVTHRNELTIRYDESEITMQDGKMIRIIHSHSQPVSGQDHVLHGGVVDVR